MTPTDEHRTPKSISGQTTITVALCVTLILGGVQYGRQQERLDYMHVQLAALTSRIDELTRSITQLQASQHSDRR